MAKTYKGWTRVKMDENDNYFTYWYKEGYPEITDFMDGTPKGWCDPYHRYRVSTPHNLISLGFRKLEDAIELAERCRIGRED